MIDLSLVSEDAIWREIKKRNDAALLVTLKSLDSKREASQVSYCGGKFACIGLAESAKQKIIRAHFSEADDDSNP